MSILRRLIEALDYETETGNFRWKYTRGQSKRGEIAGFKITGGYIQIGIDNKRYVAHRLAWLFIYGVWPKEQIDHIDCDRSNNRIANLREATPAENRQNSIRATSRNKTTGLLGACFCKDRGKYQAEITVKGIKHHLGYHSTAKEAHAAYIEAKRQLHPFNTL